MIETIQKILLSIIFIPLMFIAPFVIFFFMMFLLSAIFGACYTILEYSPPSEVHTIIIIGMFVFSVYETIKVFKYFKYLYTNLSRRINDI